MKKIFIVRKRKNPIFIIKKINKSNRTRFIINKGVNLVFIKANDDIPILSFKSNYKKYIEKANNKKFRDYLNHSLLKIFDLFCSNDIQKDYIKNNCQVDLQMKFGEFLCKNGFPFSEAYKKKLRLEDKDIKREISLPHCAKFFLDKLKTRTKNEKNLVNSSALKNEKNELISFESNRIKKNKFSLKIKHHLLSKNLNEENLVTDTPDKEILVTDTPDEENLVTDERKGSGIQDCSPHLYHFSNDTNSLFNKNFKHNMDLTDNYQFSTDINSYFHNAIFNINPSYSHLMENNDELNLNLNNSNY